MATEYTITVEALNGERHSDTVSEGVRAEVAHMASLPEFNLGDRIATRKDPRPGYEEWTWHYYHGGRISVLRKPFQLTTGQRTGARSYSTSQAERDYYAKAAEREEQL